MQDSRLLGIWRSDAQRTRREIDARRDIPTRSKKNLKKLFGKLEIRYTRTRFYATLNGHTEVSRYKVLAKDSKSVAIVSDDLAEGGPVITHIHFEGRHFWINIGTGTVREFFKRQK